MSTRLWSTTWLVLLTLCFHCAATPPLYLPSYYQVKKHNLAHPEDFFVFRPPVAPDDYELESFANEVAEALGSSDSQDLEEVGFRRVDSCVIKGQNTFLVFHQSAWMMELIRRCVLLRLGRLCSYLVVLYYSFFYAGTTMFSSWTPRTV